MDIRSQWLGAAATRPFFFLRERQPPLLSILDRIYWIFRMSQHLQATIAPSGKG
jgi:hypothetical protein